jgi:hypothetical protein
LLLAPPSHWAQQFGESQPARSSACTASAKPSAFTANNSAARTVFMDFLL